MEGTSRNDELCVDDFYFSALVNEDQLFPISDEKYAEELQLQEALISSAISSRVKQSSPITADDTTSNKKQKAEEKVETGECSQIFCTICMEGKPPTDVFNTRSCSHSFCTDCISKHIAAKIQENITTVRCPDMNCKGVLEPEFCQSILPRQVFERWGSALCEALVLGYKEFYCPFKDCSAMLIDDGEKVVIQSECPNCRRLFCAQCKVAWHAGMRCREFQALGKDERGREDIMVMELAKNKNWKRCPKCKFYVEKTQGCLHISCRCGFQFCYGCGSDWNQHHACSRLAA